MRGIEGKVAMLHMRTSSDGRPALGGELDLLSVPALEAALTQLSGPVEIDMSGVTFFDSSALRTFLTARRRNSELRIVNPSKSVVKVLEVTGTLDYLVHGREIAW
jgi:anti-anti-sigma factor